MASVAMSAPMLVATPTGRPQQQACIWMRCPQCASPLGAILYDALTSETIRMRCSRCSFFLSPGGGIWNALPAERKEYFQKFIHDYEFIRAREARGSGSAEFYLALPFEDLTGKNRWQWKIRGTSFRHLQEKTLREMERQKGHKLLCLDLGAGNGWMSYRLSQMGHLPVAVDLLTNSFDGLGAAKHYQSVLRQPFPCFQAELDYLPFADGQFDCAIFSASFHYSENYEKTLGEAIRCLRPGGVAIIVDSPWYGKVESGQQMVRERQEQFLQLYGIRSDSLEGEEFLTDEKLARLEVRFDVRWVRETPWYGLRWMMRPYLAKLKKQRTPSAFHIFRAEVAAR